MADQIAMIPVSGDEADHILILEQKVEEMKSEGWTVVGDKPTPSKPKAMTEKCIHCGHQCLCDWMCSSKCDDCYCREEEDE